MLLEDELLDGYIGRLANFIGCARIDTLLKALLPEIRDRDISATDFLGRLCEINGSGLKTLLQKHTVVGALLIPAESFSSPSAYPPGRKFAYRCWSDYAKDHLWLCPECIQADLLSLPFAYWRRGHQLPGRYHCRVHRCNLRFIPQPTLASLTPNAALKQSHLPSQLFLSGIADNPAMQRAADFIDFALYERAAVDPPGAHAGCTADSSHARAAFELSDPAALEQAIRAAFPPKWLRWALPNGKLRCGRYETPLHTSRAPKPIGLLNLAMTASILFPSVDTAIHALKGARPVALLAT